MLLSLFSLLILKTDALYFFFFPDTGGEEEEEEEIKRGIVSQRWGGGGGEIKATVIVSTLKRKFLSFCDFLVWESTRFCVFLILFSVVFRSSCVCVCVVKFFSKENTPTLSLFFSLEFSAYFSEKGSTQHTFSWFLHKKVDQEREREKWERESHSRKNG